MSDTAALPLVLASASPRRAALLEQVRIPFRVQPADIDETALPGEQPEAYVRRLALAKARAVAADLDASGCVLAADTIVEIDGDILGKPASEAEARQMLQRLSGTVHRVLTGVAGIAGTLEEVLCVRTEVTFAELSAEMIDRYLQSGESFDKAGAYGIQGVGGVFVVSVRGSYGAVVGLPLAETESLLTRLGYDTWAERRA